MNARRSALSDAVRNPLWFATTRAVQEVHLMLCIACFMRGRSFEQVRALKVRDLNLADGQVRVPGLAVTSEDPRVVEQLHPTDADVHVDLPPQVCGMLQVWISQALGADNSEAGLALPLFPNGNAQSWEAVCRRADELAPRGAAELRLSCEQFYRDDYASLAREDKALISGD